MARRLKRFSIILIVILIGLIVFLEFGANLFYKKEELNEFVRQVSCSEKLSGNFYNIHDKLYNSRKRNVRKALLNAIVGQNGDNTNCYDFKTAKIIDTVQNRILIPKLLLAFYLNRKIGFEKCFDYFTSIEFEHFEDINPRNYSLKELDDTTQILEFLIMKKAPLLYSKKADFVKQEIETLKIKLTEK